MQFEINAKARNTQGTGASRRLRRAAKVPAVVYGGEKAAQSIELDHNEIYLALRKEAFHASIINLNIDGTKEPVLLRDTQMHPYKRIVMHIDFQRINQKEKLHIKVPLHFINADIAPGVKLGGGHVNHGANELDISCLPADLPEFIEVDLQNLNLGQALHASEVTLPKGVTLITHGSEDQVVVSIAGKKAEETEAGAGEEGAGETA